MWFLLAFSAVGSLEGAHAAKPAICHLVSKIWSIVPLPFGNEGCNWLDE